MAINAVMMVSTKTDERPVNQIAEQKWLLREPGTSSHPIWTRYIKQEPILDTASVITQIVYGYLPSAFAEHQQNEEITRKTCHTDYENPDDINKK